MATAPPRPKQWLRDLVVILSLALLPRLALSATVSVRPTWDGAIYERAATQLARGEGYTQRALRETAPARPSAYYPVGWPAVLAAARLITHNRAGDIALQFTLSTLTAMATYLLARRYMHRRRALVCGAAVAAWPSLVLTSYSWMSEPLFTLLLVMSALPLAWTRRLHQPRALAISCFVLGCAALVRPIALGVALLTVALRVRWREPRTLLPALAATALLFVPIAPWAARNAATLGEPVLISTNGGTNLLLGTLDDGRFGRIPSSVDCPHGLTEVARDRCRRDVALSRIREHPATFVGLGFQKLVDTFAYETAPALEFADSTVAANVRRPPWAPALAAFACVPYVGLLLLLMLGLLRRLNRVHGTLARIAGACIAATAFVHAATLGGDRYHLPLLPILIVISMCVTARPLRPRSL